VVKSAHPRGMVELPLAIVLRVVWPLHDPLAVPQAALPLTFVHCASLVRMDAVD
jgi:hypothetical protein